MCISGLNGHVTFTVAAGRFMVEKTRKPEAPFHLVYEVYEIIGRTLCKKKKWSVTIGRVLFANSSPRAP